MTSTERLYAKGEQHFMEWCARSRIRFPASHDQVARYLTTIYFQHGASTAAIRMAIVGKAYRTRGHLFDTKHPSIRMAMKPAYVERHERARQAENRVPSPGRRAWWQPNAH